jgi:uncharacterized protein (DUF488 family)
MYTLGYSGRSIDEFVNLLIDHQIKIVVDIRSSPSSKIEYFDKKHLETQLSEKNINYFYLGKELGGFRKEGFSAYMQTIDFKMALVNLKEIALKGNTAVICFEKNPAQCHRQLIASALATEGWRITHIID